MDHTRNGTEETKEQAHNEDQNVNSSENSRDEIVDKIVQILNTLFEPNNLSNNAYFIHRANDPAFYIPVKAVYDEKSIKAQTYDRQIINQALERAENVTVSKRGDIIEAVKPKHDQTKNTLTVKGIAREDENDFKQLVNSIEGAQEGIVDWIYNPQLNAVTILCQDEGLATELFNHLSTTTFKDSHIDCSHQFGSLYILGLENLKRRNKQQGDFQQNRRFMMPNNYPMQPFFFNPMNNGFMKNNYFPPNNFYMQPPMFNQQMNPMNMGMNPNINPQMGRPNYYNKPGGRGRPYNKRPYRGGGGGGRGGGRYHRGDYKSSNQPTTVEVNEQDFPPLGNENADNQ